MAIFKKHFFITLLFCAFVLQVSAQSEPDSYKQALKNFTNLYNTDQFDNLFAQCSPETQKALPLAPFKASFTQVKSQLGNLNSTELIKYEAPVAEYKATFEKASVQFNMALNAQNKYQVLFFKPLETVSASTSSFTFDASLSETPYTLKNLGGTLSGSLVMPKSTSAKVPVVLIIPGSGPTDRNGNSDRLNLHTNVYTLLANELGKKGIATLRYDKRLIGKSISSTKEDQLRIDDMIEDALSIMNDLKEKNQFSKIIVLGHSEGSLIGMIASLDAQINGFISVAGAGEPAEKILTEQMKSQPKYIADGFKKVLDSLRRGKLTPNIDPALYAFARPSIQNYLMSWCRFDPAKEIKKLKIPILILQGTTDLQIGTQQAEKLKKAKSDAQLVIIPNMNHILKDAPADAKQNMATYTNPALPLKPELITSIVTFVNGTK